MISALPRKRIDHALMPNAANTKPEATYPIAVLSITSALWAKIAGTITTLWQTKMRGLSAGWCLQIMRQPY
jgi:hypothetical protein